MREGRVAFVCRVEEKEIAPATTSTAKTESQNVPPKGLPNYTRSQVRRKYSLTPLLPSNVAGSVSKSWNIMVRVRNLEEIGRECCLYGTAHFQTQGQGSSVFFVNVWQQKIWGPKTFCLSVLTIRRMESKSH